MSLLVAINGAPVSVLEKSATKKTTLDGRSTLQFTVRDDTGLLRIAPAQPVSLLDTISGEAFSGFVNDAQATNYIPSVRNSIVVQAVDNLYRVDKRLYTGPEYQQMDAADIATDMLRQAGEGITASYAVDNVQTQADFSRGTLTGLAATANNGGDLELVAAGADEKASLSGATIAKFSAIKFQGTASQGFSNNYTYRKIFVPTSTYVVATNDFLQYDVWIQSDSPQIMAAVDISFSDGTNFRDTNGGFADFQGLPPHPKTDLSGYANDQWYQRNTGLGGVVGKTISYISIAFEGDNAGVYTAYFRRLFIGNGATHKIDVITDTTTSLQRNSLISDNGYSNVSASIVQACNKSNQAFYSAPLDSVNTIRSAVLTWNPSATAALPSDAQFYVQYSLDVGSSRQLITNGIPFSTLLAGANVVGKSCFFWKYAIAGKDPTALPAAIPDATVIFYTTAPNFNVGSGVFQKFDLNSEWDTGVHSGTRSGGQSNLQMSGYVAPFANFGDWGTATLFGAGGGNITVVQQTGNLSCAATSEQRLRLDAAGAWQNGTIEADVLVHTGVLTGIVYRTTGWSSTDSTYAYCVEVGVSSIALNRGTNGGAAASTGIGSASYSLASDSWHHLKIVVNGSQHTVFLDDIQYINVSDATYSAAGQIAIRNRNTTAATYTAQYRSFGVQANSLSGTWTSPSIDISPAAFAGSNIILWDNTQSTIDGLSYIPIGAAISVATSLDGGTTWTPATNGGAIAGLSPSGLNLAGKSLKLQVTLTAANAAFPPTLGGVSIWILPQYTARGTRQSPPLLLSGVGRAGSTFVGWSGTQPPNTSILLESSLDAINWTTVGSGATNSGAIAGINIASDPLLDDFTTNSSANYTSTNGVGGAPASWTFDTANMRVIATGGTRAHLLYNTPTSSADVDVSAILDRADSGGFVWRYADASNYYSLVVADSGAASSPNTLQLYKTIAGTRIQIGATQTIAFQRGTPHVFHVTMTGTTISVSMDGVSVMTANDGAISAAGNVGLRNDGGTAQYYYFRMQTYGDDVSSKQVFTRVTLTSNDATVQPFLDTLITSVHSSDIQSGAFIASTQYSVISNARNTISGCIDDLAKRSGGYIWRIDENTRPVFRSRQAALAPFAVTSNDILGVPTIDNVVDLYRNSQWITNGVDTVLRSESKVGDGTAKSFALGLPVDAIVSVDINGVAGTFGLNGTSTGKTIYYTQGNNSIALDSSAAALTSAQTLNITYYGQRKIVANVRRDAEIAARAAIDATSGIVEESEDGGGASKAAIITLANSRLNQYCVGGRTMQFDTLRGGLAAGQIVALFIPQYGLIGDLFLITDVSVTWRTATVQNVSILQAVYTVSATEGAVTGDWTRFLSNLHK
jgi:hypothetical protein